MVFDKRRQGGSNRLDEQRGSGDRAAGCDGVVRAPPGGAGGGHAIQPIAKRVSDGEIA